MRSTFSLARTLSLALVAIGTVACVSSETFAANRTWTPVASGTTAARWGTASVYAPNWSSSSNPLTNPTAADSAIFNSNAANARTVTPIANNVLPIGDLKFSGSNSVIFANALGSSIVISGNSASPSVGISLTGSGSVAFQGKVVVNRAQVTFENSGSNLLSFGGGGLDLQGNYLKVAGNAAQGSLGSSNPGATYEVVSGAQTLTFDSVTGGNVNVVVNGGTVSGDGTGSSNLTVSGGTYVGGGTYDNIVSSSGAVKILAGQTLNSNSFTQTAGGDLQMNVNDDLSSASVTGNYQLGGSFQLDASDLGTNLYGMGTVWSLFQGTNYTAGSPSPLNGSSNFSVFAMSPSSSSSPYYGTFTRFGQEWTSPIASDGTYLVFQAQTGNLVVVPEPSTMVFAGLGVAMSGWTMWKKRRLSKLLAAKAG
ncbi:MAG: hypothetical protein NT171_19715 [Planctomycetota bacterium]|nr:hypothetical protein [Planctomycetota bacterium]